MKANKNEPSFSNSEALQNALRQVPDVRQAEVARATSLVNSAQYPPSEVMHKLANLLVDHLNDSDSQ